MDNNDIGPPSPPSDRGMLAGLATILAGLAKADRGRPDVLAEMAVDIKAYLARTDPGTDRTGEFVRVDELRLGDRIYRPDGWQRVTHVGRINEWMVSVGVGDGDGEDVSWAASGEVLVRLPRPEVHAEPEQAAL